MCFNGSELVWGLGRGVGGEGTWVLTANNLNVGKFAFKQPDRTSDDDHIFKNTCKCKSEGPTIKTHHPHHGNIEAKCSEGISTD